MRSYLALSVLLAITAPTFAALEQETTLSGQQPMDQEKKMVKEDQKKAAEGNEAKVSGDASGSDLNAVAFADSGAKSTEFGGLSTRTFDGESKNKVAALGAIPYNSYRSKPPYTPEKPTPRLSDDRPSTGHHSIRTQSDQPKQAGRSRYQSKYKKPHHEPEDIHSLHVRPVHIGESGHGGRDLSGHGVKGSSGGKGKKRKKPDAFEELLNEMIKKRRLEENRDLDEEDGQTITTTNSSQPSGNIQVQPSIAPSQAKKTTGAIQGAVGAKGNPAGKKKALTEDEVVPSIMDDLRNHKGFKGGFRSSLPGLDLKDELK